MASVAASKISSLLGKASLSQPEKQPPKEVKAQTHQYASVFETASAEGGGTGVPAVRLKGTSAAAPESGDRAKREEALRRGDGSAFLELLPRPACHASASLDFLKSSVKPRAAHRKEEKLHPPTVQVHTPAGSREDCQPEVSHSPAVGATVHAEPSLPLPPVVEFSEAVAAPASHVKDHFTGNTLPKEDQQEPVMPTTISALLGYGSSSDEDQDEEGTRLQDAAKPHPVRARLPDPMWDAGKEASRTIHAAGVTFGGAHEAGSALGFHVGQQQPAVQAPDSMPVPPVRAKRRGQGREWEEAASFAKELDARELTDPAWNLKPECHPDGSVKRSKKGIVTDVWTLGEGTVQTSLASTSQKRKHQINWLVQDFIDNEQALSAQAASQASKMHQTQRKYGW